MPPHHPPPLLLLPLFPSESDLYLHISSNVVRVDAQEMPETVAHEQIRDVVADHLLDLTMEQTGLHKFLGKK